ncbi:hypothetical protein FIBSPDRAFT_342390 [Athelia psychrophila]|uniref:Uncharacterized protein n=1 Tax=Athelia psychrophila TaxID=1759441 RepID=A0A166Q183_9AGAM|nr:hypothetical protein FIBSPDRAFT_342390 [Fibularhizoctonia sp. CBS 109695]
MEDADTDAGSASGNAADTDADSGTASAAARAAGAAVDTGGNADVDADVDKGKWKLQHNHTSATRARGAADTHLAVAGGSRGNTSATRADGAATSRAGCGNGAAQFGGGDVDSGASSTSLSVRAGATSTTVDAFGRAPAASGSAIPILARPSATVVFAGDEDMEKGTGSLDVNNCNINAILMASAPPPSAPPDLESADGAPASPPGFAPARTAAGAESSVADTENSPPPAPAGFTPSTDFDCDSRDASTSALPARATPTAAREHGSLFGEAPAASGARGAIRGPSGRAGVGAICNSEDEDGEKDEEINFNVMLSVPSRPTLESARVPGFAPTDGGADCNFVDNANAHTPQSALPGSVLGAHAANSSRGASDGNDDNDNVPMLMSMASASAGADFNFEDNAHFGSTLAAVGDAHAASYEEGDNDNASMLMSTTGADYKFEDDASTLGGAANNSRSASYETDDYDNGDAEMSTSTPESPSAAGPPTIPRTSSSFRRSFSYSSEDNASPIAADASPLNRPHTFPIARDGLHGGASYEMASTAWIPPAAEVLNTYGGALGNGALLAQYGFALAANERDAVVFTWADCVRAASSRARGTGAGDRWATPGFQACAGVARAWAAAVPATLWDGSGLVYVDANAKRGGYGGREAAWQGRVNADGRICEGLWVFCALASGISASLPGPGHRDIDYAAGSDVVAQLGELAGLQLALEGASYGGDDGWESDGMGGGLRLGDPAADPERRPSRRPDRVGAVGRVVRTVVDLCDSRRTQLIGHTDLAAALDVGSPLLSPDAWRALTTISCRRPHRAGCARGLRLSSGWGRCRCWTVRWRGGGR